MKIVKNKFSDAILFGDTIAMTVWPWIFVKTTANFSKADEFHERVHGRQQVETMIVTWFIIGTFAIFGFIIPWYIAVPITLFNFYLWYILSWVVQIILPPWNTAYRDICFEKEAYDNENNPEYLNAVKSWFGWTKYLFRIKS